jgi:hypothetical protein
MNVGTDDGAMPAKLSENIRPTVMAGLAKLVELVSPPRELAPYRRRVRDCGRAPGRAEPPSPDPG